MLIPFYTSRKRRPWLIAIFATAMIAGLVVLLLTRG